MLLNEKQMLLVAGFGLREILQLQGVASRDQPYAHLLSIAETFLFAPEYLAPEVVQGQSPDPRSDIYALGIILFEVLSGHPPFTGTNALDIASQHVQRPMLSLQAQCPDLPVVLLSVMNQALARDPAHRFQDAHAFVEAFAHGVRGGMPSSGGEQMGEKRQQETLTRWQITPPIVTGKMVALQPSKPTRPPSPHTGLSDQRFVSSYVTGEDSVIGLPTVKEKEAPFLHSPQPVQEPDKWLFSPETPAQPPLTRSQRGKRRRVAAFFITSVVLAAVITVAIGTNLAGIRNLPLFSQRTHQPSSVMPGTHIAGSTTATKRQNTVEHTGTVIGSLNIPFNATVDFLNPADHQQSVLIHLPSGEFVAYEKACNSLGAQVSYNTETHTLVCPTNGSVFDPVTNGAVLQGPAIPPLKQVMVRVNRDETITTG